MNEEVEVVCPSCSPRHPVLHEVLKSGVNPVVKCLECGRVHPTVIETPKIIDLKVIVSRGEASFPLHTHLQADDIIHVGDEMFIDDEASDEVYPVVITAIESGQKRPEAAKVADINSLWGRAIDEVCVKIAIHEGTTTRSVIKQVPGGYQFTIGSNEKAGPDEFKIIKIKERDGSFKSRDGVVIEAKNIKRIFANPVHRRSWGSGTSWSSRRREQNW
jgi:uncharacterized Zn finger protein